VQFAITRDSECAEFLVVIVNALKAANWEPKPWGGPGFPLTVAAVADLPVGEITARGIAFTISEAYEDEFSSVQDAFAAAMSKAGFATRKAIITDKLADGKPNPGALPHGAVRITIGTRV
jgi:hypothetical protein